MIVYLSLGANLGNREQSIDTAIELLNQQAGPLIKRSSFFYSKPWGFDSPNDFCNICAAFDTDLSPLELLRTTQSIERQLGRTAKTATAQNRLPLYSDRTIDIDILLYGDLNMDTPELTIPHKNMEKREFVMLPLQEIAPHLPFFAEK